ncbi:Phosphotransferase enzyme family protein [Dethiosulfatibacter aminovorans DSM 17477]|uniref:Phosphotransferase enzyme family protein n=1 Tax=Dethiosulfatibacter aminovorans DSM 17477 TaxID=1121476 RepID=A0A1M6H2M9_9FIRM|nr:aminoglycoside phosphotransferase family protein [Dethiosulfatibacter aminovorans]SHJ16440.1 Phosphotransferase enzyme family protein [Dethiosulfatibacter aminovorans DSM 17477]
MDDEYLKKFISEKYIVKTENIHPIGNHRLGRNYVYLIKKNEMELVVKVSISQKKWHNEIISYKLLKGLEFIPEIYETGKTRDLYYLISKKIEGKMLDEVWFRKSFREQIKISGMLGKTLAQIHDWKSFNHYNSWEDKSNIDIVKDRESRDKNIVRRLATCNLLDHMTIRMGIAALPEFREKLENKKSVIAHRDFSFRNILVNDENEVTGVLDFEHTIPDDPSMDICTILQTSMFDNERLFNSFIKGYTSVKDFPENFINNKSYYYLITGLYMCSKYDIRREGEILRGISLIKKGLSL